MDVFEEILGENVKNTFENFLMKNFSEGVAHLNKNSNLLQKFFQHSKNVASSENHFKPTRKKFTINLLLFTS
jgi:hypothetical protein